METLTAPTVTTVAPVVAVTPPPATVVAPATPVRKSQKGKWGKVGAPPKPIKYPRGAYTIAQLVALNPQVCELTLRNTVTNAVRGFKMVKKVQVPVPVTIVKLPKNYEKDTVGRPNFRFMSKAAYDSTQANLRARKTLPVVVAPAA